MPGPMDQYLQMMQQRVVGAPPPMAPMQPQQMPKPAMPTPAPNPLAMMGMGQMPQLPTIGQLAQPQMPQLPQMGGLPGGMELPQMQIPMPPTGPLASQMPNFTSMLQEGQSAISQAATKAAQVPLPPPPKPQAVPTPAATGPKKAFIDLSPAERTQSLIDSGHAIKMDDPGAGKFVGKILAKNKQNRQGGSNK